MSRIHITMIFGSVLTVLFGLSAGKAEDKLVTDSEDLMLLCEAGIGRDGPSLLSFLKQRSSDKNEPRRINALIQDLGSEDFEKRQQTSARIAVLGRLAFGPLQHAARITPD